MTLLEELALLAAELGLGTYPGSIFRTKMPTSPDSCLVVARYGGPESSLADDYDEPSIQWRIRGPAADVSVAEELAERVYDRVHGLGTLDLPGGTWLQLMVGIQSGPIFIGLDQNNRPEFTVNVRCEVSRTSTNRST
ncbi:minor capsid protein [Streptosporangium sp. G12]